MARGRDQSADIPKAKFTRENIREGMVIFNYLKPYKWWFIGGLIFISLSSLTTMAFPYLLKSLVDSAQGIKEGPLALFTPGNIALLMIAQLTLQMGISFMRIYLFTRVGENAVADMRKDIYRRLIAAPMDFFAQRRVGELSSRLSADVTQIQDTITTSLAEILRGFLTLVIGICLILFISPKLTGLMLSVVPVIVIAGLVFSRFIRKSSRKTQDQLAESSTVVQETLSGITSVKAFANEWYEEKRYSSSIRSVVNMAVRNGVMRGAFVSFLLFSVFGAIVLVVWYAVTSHSISFGDLTAFVVYTAFVGGTMAGFADLFSQLQKTLGATQRVRELLHEPVEEVVMHADHQQPVRNDHKLHGNVSLKNLSFTYVSRPGSKIIDDISLDVKPGQQIALVGPSGAGKSTLAYLLLRFYDPQSGQLLFDGKPAIDFPLSELRLQIGYVPQDVMLFGGTIYENIAYGKPGASLEEVQAAARKANAHDFISSFPEAYETIVGERGLKLSGGQRQRIAIARAILKDPVILVLDEATSALDSESEALVQEALNNLMQSRTSFVIAHRLSTIRNADLIVVMEEGRIREQGTHSELMQLETGLYRSLSERQQMHFV